MGARRLKILGPWALLLAACPTTPARDNPLDPESPSVSAGAVAGRVSFDDTGRLLADVPVTAVEVSVEGSAQVAADTTGAFRVEGVKAGAHVVELRAPYCDVLRLEAAEVAPGQTLDLGELSLRRGRGSISGRVLVSSREAFDAGCAGEGCGDHSGTQVSISNHPASQPRFTVTNLEGAFELTEVAAGKRKLTIQRSGYDPAQVEVELLPDGTVALDAFTLGVGFSARVQGKVQLEGVNTPSSTYTSVRVELSGGVGSTSAADTGDFLLSSPLGGTFTVVVTAPGYERRDVPGVVLKHNSTVDLFAALGGPITLRRARGAALGTVQVAGAGNDGVQVCAEGYAYCGVSAASGAFRIDDIPAGLAFRLLATKRVGLGEFAGQSATHTITVGNATDFGPIALSRISGDFQLEGRSIDPASEQLSFDKGYTVEEWVRLDLSQVRQPGFDFLSLFADGGFLGWLPIPTNAPFCPDAGAGSVLCAHLPAEGVNEVRVQLANGLDGGTQQLGPFRGTIVYDKTPPSGVGVVVNGGAKYVNAVAGTQPLSLEVTGSDPSPLRSLRLAAVSAPASALAALSTANAVPFSAAPGVAIPDPLVENLKKVAVRVYDSAGNSAQAEDDITLDRTAPLDVRLQVLTNDAGYVRQGLVTVRVGADAGDLASVRLANGSNVFPYTEVPLSAGGPDQQLPWLFPAGDGLRTVYAQFLDEAGNASAPPVSASAQIDSTPPSVPALTLSENPCDGGTDTRANGFTRYGRVCVDVNAPGADRLEVAGCSVATAPPTRFECSFTSTSQGVKTLSVTAVDLAGNASGQAVASLVYDTVPPPAPPLSLLRSPGASQTSSAKFVNNPFVVYTAGPPVDPDVAEVRLEQGAQVTPWAPFAPAGLCVLASADAGVHRVALRARDLAENEGAAGPADQVTLDDVPPLIPAATLVGRNANGFVQDAGVRLDVTSTAAQLDQNFDAVLVSGVACTSPASCAAPAAPASFSLSLSPDAQSFVRVSARDLAGNVGAEALIAVTHDGQDPETPEILEPPLEPCLGLERFTSSSVQSVSIANGATDQNFDSFEVLTSAPGQCNASDPGWTRTSATNSFPMPVQAGVNHLCVRAVDLSGRRSGHDELRVVQDSVAPAVPLFGPDQTVNSEEALVYVKTAATDSNPVWYEVIGGPLGAWTRLPLGGACAAGRDAGSFYGVPVIEDAENMLFFRAVDLAGNASAASLPVRVQERSTWALSSGIDTEQFPMLEGDRAVWSSTSQGVLLFDLLRQDPVLGDVGAQAYDGGGVRGATVHGNLLTWVEGNNRVSYCKLTGAGVCGPVTAPAGARTTYAPVAAGQRIVYSWSGADAGVYALDTVTNTTAKLAAAPAGPFTLGARRVFDAAGGYPGNVAHARASWVNTSAVFTRRTDEAAPTQLFSAGAGTQVPTNAWTDGRWVLWGAQSVSSGQLSLVACREPFAAPCAPLQTVLPSGPFSGPTVGAFVPQAGVMMTSLLSELPRPNTPLLSTIGPDAGVVQARHPVAGVAVNPVTQAGKMVYVRSPGGGRNIVELVDFTTDRPIDAAIGASNPAVSGQWVAWLDPRFSTGAAVDVITANVSTGEHLRRTTASAVRGQLSFDFPWVVWAEGVGPGCTGAPCVRYLNLTSGAAGRVGNSNCSLATPFNSCTPRVSGQRVTWTDFRGASPDIYLYDLGSAVESVVAATANAESSAWLSGDRVVWQEVVSGADYRIRSRHFGPTAGCPATECVAGPAASGCRFTGGPLVRNHPSVHATPGAPCQAHVAWEEGYNDARIGVFDWARGAARVLEDDLMPAPFPATPRWGPQYLPVATANWVAFGQSRQYTFGINTPPGDVIRLYWWAADAIGTVALGSQARWSPASDGASVVYLQGFSGTAFEVRQYRPPPRP